MGRQAIWESAVTVTGIALCILIVVVSIGFVVHHRIAQRRTRAKLKQTPAHRALLGPPSASVDPSRRHSPGGSVASGGRHRHRSPSSVVTPAGSRRASEAERGPPRTPGSVRAGSGMSPMKTTSPHNPVRTRTDAVPAHGTTPDSVRKQRSGVPSPALSLRSRTQQPQGKMVMLEQLRYQRRNVDDDVLSPPPSKKTGAARTLGSKDSAPGRHEDIRMEPYFRRNRNRKQIQDEDDDDDSSFVYGQRPPVEGQDSLTRDKSIDDLEGGGGDLDLDLQKAKFVPPKKSSVAEIRDLRSGRDLRSLDLIPGYDVMKKPCYPHPGATTPLSITSAGELSAALERTDLFPELEGGRGALCDDDSPCDFITTDEFEYDDYVSHLPGSYFTMDPQAYTLTWSHQPPSSWAAVVPRGGKALVCPSASRTNSETSIDPDRIY